jgi:hypothetical protein
MNERDANSNAAACTDMTETEAQLIEVFKRYTTEQGLGPLGDAEDLLARSDLSIDQRTWLTAFVLRWNAAMLRRDALLSSFKHARYVTAGAWLKAHGREFPKPNADGLITAADYELANVPMVVACAGCNMTMVCHPDLACNDAGQVFCAGCAKDA